MVKKASEKGEQKANLYLLAIVAIVAIVGIVVFVSNSGIGLTSVSEDDLAGQAYSSLSSLSTESKLGVKHGSPCRCGKDSSGGCIYPCPEK